MAPLFCTDRIHTMMMMAALVPVWLVYQKHGAKAGRQAAHIVLLQQWHSVRALDLIVIHRRDL